MSVIIRLQNLPWSANALDVRTFFKGLSIPDGGVHIVGGEMGDAFIAFRSTDQLQQLSSTVGFVCPNCAVFDTGFYQSPLTSSATSELQLLFCGSMRSAA
ncbi:conserved hypothetical protein [Culex quinquefasciatus]|uniref:RRM domain-containing protein n=1 Tax=Culex quinquefasciatus TaxID=7176 RepID=B0WVW7_CULQU|nr:conserved hypothetical protein [Culex quinquefasciatus]|eukprot:XP_001861539.1 conserved hypothetical protein [Culex quinquefasciatus]